MATTEDVLLEAGATIDITPYQAGLDKMVESTQAAATGVKSSFESVAAADTAVSQSVQNISTQTASSFANVRTGGIFAFDAVRAKMIEATAEVARLRNEILQTDDPAALSKLRAQLREATLEMTAARTEMRALRFEGAETTEKMDLLAESAGVKIPGALGKLLGRLPIVQEAMAAAFSVAVIGIFIDAILEIPDAIGKVVDKLVDWDEEAKKNYEDNIRLNREAVTQVVDLANKRRELAEVGVSGAQRQILEEENLKEHLKDISKQSTDAIRALEEHEKKLSTLKGPTLGERFGAEKEKFEKGEQPSIVPPELAAAGQAVADWATRAKEKIKEEETAITGLRAEIQRLNSEQLKLKEFEIPRAGANVLKDNLEIQIANDSAATEQRKRIQTSYIDYYVSGLKRLFSEEKINLGTEVEGEREAVAAKLEIDRAYAAERIAELNRKGATGANVQPELDAVRGQLAAAEIATKTQLADIDARFDRQTEDHANNVSLALAEASKRTAEQQVSATESSARRQLEARQISIDQETAILRTELNKRLDAERDVTQEELRIASQRPNQEQARIIELTARLKDLEQQRVDGEIAITEDGTRRKNELLRREEEEQIRFTRETSNLQLEATRHSDDERLKAHAISLTEWEASERGALDRWYAAQHATFEKAAADAARMFGTQSLEYRRVLNEMAVLDEKFATDSQRIDQRVAQQFEQTMNVISHSFSSAFDRMLTEHTRFSTVMENFWNQIAQGWARMGIQIVSTYIQTLAQILLQEALTALRIQVIHTQTTNVKKATETLFDTFLNAIGIKRTSTEQSQEAAGVIPFTTAESQKTAAVTAGQAAQTAAVTTGIAFRQAAETSGNAESILSTVIANESKIVSEAGLAGAAGFASVMAALPFPINVSTAPEVAATAAASTLDFLAVGSADKGAFLEKDSLIQAHKYETVLPPPLSLGFKNIIENGAIGTPQIPEALARPAPPNSTSQVVDNSKNFHISPSIEVHQHGDASGKMSHEDIAEAVHMGIRRGTISLRGAV